MPEESQSTHSTVPPQPSPRWAGFERGLHRFTYALMAVLLAGAMAGLFGLRTSTVSESRGGLRLAVDYASVTRPGLATPFRITVDADSGQLPGRLSVRIPTDYLALLDEHGLFPQPAEMHQTSQSATWTFELPEGSRQLEVELDARLEPSIHLGEEGSVAVLVDGEEVIDVRFRTWVVP